MNKVAIITGGGGGIGMATSQVFSENGYTCVVVDVNKENADRTVASLDKNLKHWSVVADISSPKQIDQLFRDVIQKFKRVDALVNLAASNRTSFSPDDNIEQRWDKTIDNDLKSVYMMSERAVVEMQKLGGGAIVNVGSIAGGILGSHSLPYAAAKAGIVAITKSHARIYGSHNIRVNCIVPGIIDTNMVHDSVAQKEDSYFNTIRDFTPLKRWGEPREIGEALFFAASDKCKFMTGASIVIDGGATLTLGPRLDEQAPFKWDKFKPELK